MKPSSGTILLANHEPDDAELLIGAFRAAEFENMIHVVDCGEEAIQYLKGEGPYTNRKKFAWPRLLLLEMAMPGIGGGGVLTWLNQQRQLPFLPVVVFGGPGDEREKALHLGAAAYEVKPAAFEELVKLVEKIGSFWLLSTF